MTDAVAAPVLSARGINKSFPGVQALTDVDFDLCAGQVHALVGENGAGKSTLTKIIAGLEQPDAGAMQLLGRPYQPRGRLDAQAHGVRMVTQELNLVGTLTIAENVFVEKIPNRFGFIRYTDMNRRARAIMEAVGLGHVNPSVQVRSLSVGQQQMVEIAAGLSRKCKVLVLDEPTASLTDSEIELLFARIGRLKAERVGVVYISHRIEEVLAIADHVTVLRDGRHIDTRSAEQLTAGEVIRLMVGRTLPSQPAAGQANLEQVALKVDSLRCAPNVRDVSFELNRGEILGLAGLMGSGRTEAMRAVFGAERREAGDIFLYSSDQPARINSPADAVRQGIALLTEDRKEQGLLLTMAIRTNVSLTNLPSVSWFGWLNPAREDRVARDMVARLDIKCTSTAQMVGRLSGGNQQKVVIAKWLFRDCDVLIFDEPTRGIDVGAKFEIYRMLSELAGRGKAVIFVSSDLKELMSICDRIMVMSRGCVAATFARGEWTQEKIMTAAFREHVAT